MPRNSSFVGQRADKAIVVDVGGVETIEQPSGMVKNGVVKEVQRYTITCPLCDGDGYYDQRGDIVCEDCACVINDRPVAIREDYSGSRGFRDNTRGARDGDSRNRTEATNEPSI